MNEMATSTPPEVTKKERLPDKELGKLIAAVGNHEVKGLTLILISMRPKTIYTRQDLYRQMLGSQGKPIIWNVGNSLLFEYCSNSLAPIGLVAEEIVDKNLQTHGFIITDAGKNLGVPLAGLLLEFSAQYPQYSLHDFFGGARPGKLSTNKDENSNPAERKRSPLSRLKILWELTTADLPIRQTELAQRIGESHGMVADHLEELAARGVIQYSSVKTGRAYSQYRFKTDNPGLSFRNDSVYTKFVFDTLKLDPNKQWNVEEIEDQYRKFHPQQEQNNDHIPGITSGLMRLVNSGLIERVGKFDLKKQSEIDLTEEQRNMLVELVGMLDAFQELNLAVIGKGKAAALRIISDPKQVSQLLLKAREHSPYASIKPSEEKTATFLEILRDNPNSTASEVRTVLLNNYGVNLTLTSILCSLRNLASNGSIGFITEKGGRKFFLPPQKP